MNKVIFSALVFCLTFSPICALVPGAFATTPNQEQLQENALKTAEDAQIAAQHIKEAAEYAQKVALEAQEKAQKAIDAAIQAAESVGIKPQVTPIRTLELAESGTSTSTSTSRTDTLLSGFEDRDPDKVIKVPQSIYELVLSELETNNKGWNAGGGIRIVPHGAITVQGQMSENLLSFSKKDDDNILGQFHRFSVSQRIQLGMDVHTSDTSKLTIMLRAPSDAIWGNDNRFATDNYVSIKMGQFEYTHPETKFNIAIGKLFVNLPNYALSFNPVMAEFVPGVRITQTVNDQWSYYALWLRPLTSRGDGTVSANNSHSATNYRNITASYDFFSVGATYTTPDKKLRLTPWAAYANVGNDLTPDLHQAIFSNSPRSEHDAGVWWLGLTSNYKHSDKLSFGFDFLYNEATYNDFDFAWLADAYLTYRFDKVLLTAKAWYASGDSDNSKGNLISPEAGGGWSVGNSAYFDTSLHGLIETSAVYSPTGLTGIGIGFTDYKPWSDKLTLGGGFTYARGTNSPHSGFAPRVGYLTTSDSIFEIGAHARYQLSESIVIGLQGNYIIPSFDKYGYLDYQDIYKRYLILDEDPDLENAWRIGLGARFTF